MEQGVSTEQVATRNVIYRNMFLCFLVAKDDACLAGGTWGRQQDHAERG